jgi:hypothetical protein
MKLLTETQKFLQRNINDASMAFHDELATEENKDYRRGFRAGTLFAFLQMKSDIGNIEDAFTERKTD